MKYQPMEFVQTVLTLIWRIIVIVFVLYVLVNVLFLGGCAALNIGLFTMAKVQNGIDEAALQQARHAPLPPQVRRIVDLEDTGGRNRYDRRWGTTVLTEAYLWPPQDPSGRYVLTSEGLIDFATASLTQLNCPELSSVDDRWIGFRKRWLNDRLFLWGSCVFDLETLQSVPIEELSCRAGLNSCTNAGLLEALEEILPESQRVYENGSSTFGEERFFVDLSSDGHPIHLWREHIMPSQYVPPLLEQAGLMVIPVPSQDGRTILPGTHRLSPNGEFDARLDVNTLQIRRAQDGSPVIEVRADDFHQTFATSSQRIYALGWTDDSRQVIFLVETFFNGHISLAQIFALTVP